jgi:hypothetical protein
MVFQLISSAINVVNMLVWAVLIVAAILLFFGQNSLTTKILLVCVIGTIIVYQFFKGVITMLLWVALAIGVVYVFMYESLEYKIIMGCILGAVVVYQLFMV